MPRDSGAIFGIGFWTRRTDWKIVREIVGAWVVTLPGALLLAFAVAGLA